MARSHGWTLDGSHIYEMTPAEDSLKPESQYTIFHPSEIELGETTSAVLEEFERIKPRRVVFDSLSETNSGARPAALPPANPRAQAVHGRAQQHGDLLDDRTSEYDQVQSARDDAILMEHLAVEYGAERRRLRVRRCAARASAAATTILSMSGAHHRLPAPRRRRAPPRLPEGFRRERHRELDALLGGGLDRHEHAHIGPAGSGKSTLAAQFAAEAAARGERAAVFIFDKIRETYISRAAGIGTAPHAPRRRDDDRPAG